MQYNLQTTLLKNLEISSEQKYKKPLSWPDIKKNAQDGHIYLLVDDRSPIGLTATAISGYSVKIDGVDYADYNSEAQFAIADWSNYTATEGYAIDYPTGASKAHIIDIYPQNESENISAFHCDRIAASGREAQGVLWAHFNITNTINLRYGFARYNQHYEPLMEAITAKNNLLKVSNIENLNSMGSNIYTNTSNLKYAPVFDLQNNTTTGAGSFALQQTAQLKEITIKNGTINKLLAFAANATNLKKVNLDNATLAFDNGDNTQNTFLNAYNLEELPPIDCSSAVNLNALITNAEKLKDTVLDVRAATGLKRIGCYGSSEHFMGGFKGLRVSSSAPFNSTYSPQINVSYTGMDRAALVQLFNDLPEVSDGQTINITACSGTADLTADDKEIATNKGWSITE